MMMANNLNSIKINNSNQNNSTKTSTKKIIELSCYIRIEKNGIELKFKNAMPNSLCKIIIFEILNESNAGKKSNNSNSTISFPFYQIHLKNMNNEEFFCFDLKSIITIIDKLIDEGKLTILINYQNDRTIIFIYKTSKSILENFVQQIKRINNEKSQEKISTETNLKQNLSNNFKSLINSSSNPHPHTNSTNLNKKRKIKDLYNQVAKSNNNYNHNDSINALQIKKFKKLNETTSHFMPLILKKLNFLDLPFDIKNFVYDYLDKNSLTKISLICKESKKEFDESIEKLEFRKDTPHDMFSAMIKRFVNLKILQIGKGKFLKNEMFKYFDVSLKNLEELDISFITNLNEESIRKFFSKTKSEKVKSIKLNFYLDSISSALFYVLEFYRNLSELEICYDHKIKNIEMFIKSLEKEPRCLHPSIFKTITEIISNHKQLRKLGVYFFNTLNIADNLIKNNLIQNIEYLHFDILIIEKIKDLNLLLSGVKLKSLTIKEILIGTKQRDSYKFTQCDFSLICMYQENTSNIIPLSENPEDHFDKLSLDYDNFYIEVFSNIFYKLKKLIKVNFGNFINKDILKIISLYCKDIEDLTISSNNITDDCIKNVLINLSKIKFLDLRGCDGIQGSCFPEINPWPENLKRVKLSLTNYNFYNLIEYLRSKGVDAENYLIK